MYLQVLVGTQKTSKPCAHGLAQVEVRHLSPTERHLDAHRVYESRWRSDPWIIVE